MANPTRTITTEQPAPTSHGAREGARVAVAVPATEPKRFEPRIAGDEAVDKAMRRVARDHRGLLIALSK